VDDFHFGSDDPTWKVDLKLAYAGLSRVERLADLMVSGLPTCLRFAPVSLPLASRFGFGFPLVWAVSHFRQLAHDGASGWSRVSRGHEGGFRLDSTGVLIIK
jgi:hypothetical protein